MSQGFSSLRAQFEAESNKPPQTTNPKKSWVATPFTQISISRSQSKSQTQSIDVENNSNAPKPPLPPIDSINNVEIGDEIEMTNGRVGIVRYIGNINIKKGIWIGIQLNEPNGNHDGKIKGKRYFKTAPNHATFVKYKKIKKIIKPIKTDVAESDSVEIIDSSQTNDDENIDNITSKKPKPRKRSYFDWNTSSPSSSNNLKEIDINMEDIDINTNFSSTPPTTDSHLISPPPIPDGFNIFNHSNDTTDYDRIDVDEDTAEFDIESFNNIKQKMQNALNKQCIDVLNWSMTFDTKLKDKKKYDKILQRLQQFVDGLMEYTNNRLNNNNNNNNNTSEIGEPFNTLTDKILSIDMYKYGHLCWDVALKYIEILSFLEEIVWIPLQYIAMILPSAIGIRLLFEMPQKIHIFPPIYINRVCKRIVECSQFPIAICLKIAEFTQIVSKGATAYIDEYDKLHVYYTKIALNILNDINSDHAALICIECATDLEPTTEPPLDCLQIAIRSENGKFITNKRVMSILNAIWESSSFLEGHNSNFNDHFVTYHRINFLMLLRDHYKSVPAMPCGKYAMQLLLFICQVTLLSFYSIRRHSISASFEFYEVLLWLFGLSSAAESLCMLLNNDRIFKLNIADLSSLFLGFNFGILAGIRFYYLLNAPSDSTKQTKLYLDIELTFDTVFAFTVVLAFLRVSTLFSMSERFGSLLVIVQRMTNDIQNFALLWILFVFGFVFAEYFYIAGYIDNSFSDTFLAIFAVTTGGDADFDQYTASDRVSRSRSTVSQIMLVFLVLFGALLLINLFIAMMAKTFDELSDKSNTEWSLNISAYIIQYDRRNDILPPPFNLFVYIFVLLWYMLEIPLVLFIGMKPIGTINVEIKELSFIQKLSVIFSGQQHVWICEYCHHIQANKSNENRISDIKKWMSRIGLDSRDRTAILHTDAELCEYCKRVKRSEKRYEWIADTISYYIAYIIILPVIVILTVPTGALGMFLDRIIDVEKNDMQEFYQLLQEKQKQRVDISSQRMRKLFNQKRISAMLESKED